MLVMIVCFLAIPAIEIFAQLFPIDGFILETLRYSLIISFVFLLLLSTFARRMELRARQKETLEHRQDFAVQLAHYQGWHEITCFIIQILVSLLPNDHTSLFIYDHRPALLEFVIE